MKFVISIMALCLVCTSFASQAGLLISPTRLSFEPRERVKEVVLINTSDATRTYRVDWVEYKLLENMKFEEITVEDPSVNALSPYIRYSPRQVRLAPGERQVIKLQLRNRGGMTENEYRSHLRFSALPPEEDALPDEEIEGAQIKVNVVVNYTIPVFYQSGAGDVNVALDGYRLVPRTDEGAELELDITRSGNVSAFGRLELFANVDGERKRIGIANNISAYRETPLSKRRVKIPNYAQYAGKFDTATLRYVGEGSYRGRVFFEEQVRL